VRRLLFVLVVTLVAMLGLASPVSGAAGPRYILVHGGGLPEPILLDDLAGNELLASAPDVEPRFGVPREADRPFYDLALFFIVPDLAGRTPDDLRPDETGATGRFFPAVGDLEAVFELGAVPGIGPRRDGGLTPTMLDYLVARGVPVVSDVVLGPELPTPTPPSTNVPPPEARESGSVAGWVWLLLGGAGLAGVGIAWFGLRDRRRPRRRGIHF
jgi:hypothetical protein